MRCWKSALDQIHDHNANKVVPHYAPRSETEKALVESLRQLELQCKERIDILEALRLSRQDASLAQDSLCSTSSPEVSLQPSQGETKGWIGGGTIPAITYTQLSKPELPRRPSLPPRKSSEYSAAASSSMGWATESRKSSLAVSSNAPSSETMPPEGMGSRSSSPERHTMRTTLRSGKPGSKDSRSTSRPQSSKPADGPSKAATLAWSTLGRREHSDRSKTNGQPILGSRPSENRPSLESKVSLWDSNSRRLVSPRPGMTMQQKEQQNAPELPTLGNITDCSMPQLQSLSVSAASSALAPYSSEGGFERSASYSEGKIPPRNGSPPVRRARQAQEMSQAIHEGDQRREERSTRSLDNGRRIRELSGHRPSGPTVGDGASKRVTAVTQPSRVSERRSDGPRTSYSHISSPGESARPADRNSNHVRREEPQNPKPTTTESRGDSPDESPVDDIGNAVESWQRRRAWVLKNLPPGVDDHAAKQILNEIVVQGDDVHWSDIAGLDIAKNALREAVVYPFLRPDLFMGLREPARGMLLFGPPGTGKTMLARAVATESRSTFFSISATSLTSKYLGESEKLVRALFTLAKLLAPSIIFVDEIDSLLSQRSGSGEHEATRRIKTEFLIQWSGLQRAAAGREADEKENGRGDANRVLVLAATNLPWAIDEAARRRFVRRQYIPLPESYTRATQLRTLLSQQKHTMSDADIDQLVDLTAGTENIDLPLLYRSCL